MKRIQLQKIQLSNFKSLNIEVSFNEGATQICGANGLGKTSIASAFYWLLSGYTSPYVPKNFALFDDKTELTHETPLAKVKAWLKIGDYDYVLEKTAEAKFTRSKGSSEWVKAASDVYTVYIDEIETSATAYNEWINNNICPVAMLPYVLSGEFFSYLVNDDKNKARKVLTELVGEIKDEDFKGDYSSISELMQRYTVSEIIEMSKKKKKPLEDRQMVIPNEIDRKEERLSELKAMDFTATEKEIEKIKAEIETIDGLLLGNADAVKPILEHNREIENKVANKRLSLVNGRLDYKEAQNARTSEIKAKIAEVRRYNEGVERENYKIKKDYVLLREEGWSLVKDRDGLNDDLELLREEKDNIKSRIFTEDHCPYCGAELDPMEIEKKKEEFNKTKIAKLEAIVSKGKMIKEKIEKLNERIDEIRELTKKEPILLEKQDIAPLEEALAKIEASFVPYEETDEFKRINAEIEALMSEIKEVPSNDNESLTSRKKTLIEDLSELSKRLGLKDEIGKIEKDIEELKKELKNVACSIAELEKLIYEAKSYEQEKHEIVSDRINLHLDHAKIQMFSTQKNGDIVNDCVLLNNRGVRMSSTNFADRILISLSMQMLFMKRMGVSLPIWVDESAVFSSSNLPVKEGYQMIYMFPSDNPYLEVI